MRLDDFGDYELKVLAIGLGNIFSDRFAMCIKAGDTVPAAAAEAYSHMQQAFDAMDDAREAWENDWKSKL